MAPTDSTPRTAVEDDPTCQALVCGLLQRHGYDVTVAATGEAAQALLAERPLDVVLMDVWLPGVSGYEVTRWLRLREAATTRRTPVIGVTALTMPDDRDQCLAAGMDVYLPKPYRTAALIELVEAAVGRDATGPE